MLNGGLSSPFSMKFDPWKNKEKYENWKNPQQEEVDFVVRKSLKVKELVHVCYEFSNLKTREREIRALLKASKELKCRL